jgi:hypothetical protein
VPATGGTEVQITRQGGTFAVETFDGNGIYFTSADQPPSIRWVTAGGGEERTVLENIAGFSGLTLCRDGLCYLSSLTFAGAQLNYYSFHDRTSRLVAAIEHPVHHFLSSSRDGGSVLYTEVDRQDTDLMLIALH